MALITTEGRGFSNAKAKRELGRQLRYPAWQQGFNAENAVRPGPGFAELGSDYSKSRLVRLHNFSNWPITFDSATGRTRAPRTR